MAYAWTLLPMTVVLLVAAGQLGWVGRSVLLDVVSLWPGWVLTAGILAIRHRMLRHRRRVLRERSSPAAPLLLVAWLVIGSGLHLTGWDVLPSSAGNLEGPVDGEVSAAALDIETGGDVVLLGAPGLLYEANPMPTGGGTAPAQGSEIFVDDEFAVSLKEGPDPGWFGSDGWKVSVSTSPEWSVIVRATSLEADLTTVRLNSLRVTADGRIKLAAPSGDVPISISGELVLEVPSDASMEVTGPVRVGPGWELTANGKRYVGTGTSRFVVEVGSGSNLVVEQW